MFTAAFICASSGQRKCVQQGKFRRRKAMVPFVLSMSLFGVTLPSSAVAFDTLPDLGELFDTSIDFDDIRGAFARGSYDLAVKLTLDYAYQEARQYLLDVDNIPVIIDKLRGQLREVVENPNKTREEKGEEIAKIIAANLEPYEYTSSDALNLTVKYSIEYGAAYLHWNNMIKSDRCYGGWTEMVWDPVSKQWQPIVKFYNYYHVQIPDFYVYRVVNGKQKLITRIQGRKHVSRTTLALSPDTGWNDVLVKGYNYFRDIPDATIDTGRVFWMDLHSDVRMPGETLTYKIVADNSNYKSNKCGYSNQWISTLNVDANGDGRMDFIPENAYSKYFGKYYAWLVPVIAAQ